MEPSAFLSPEANAADPQDKVAFAGMGHARALGQLRLQRLGEVSDSGALVTLCYTHPS